MSQQLLQFAIAVLAGFAAGGGAMWWIKSRPVTTKAEAMKLAAKAVADLAKLPGAAESYALAMEQLADENRAAQGLAASLAKVANVPMQSPMGQGSAGNA